MKNLKTKCQVFLLSCLLGATNAFAAIDISQAPLETGTTVDPNVVFILDDSGSMLQGLLPEDIDNIPIWTEGGVWSRTQNRWNYPTTTYTGINMTVLDMSKITNVRFLTSSHVNKNYYDPKVIYPIPLGPNGQSLGQSDFNNAWLDGYDLANRDISTNASWNKIDLRSNYRAIMSRSFKDKVIAAGSTGARWNDYAISPDGKAGQAFYYNYKQNCDKDIYHNDCYEIAYPSEAEKQNFANWFSYYRTRLMVAKAGISSAFHQQATAMRVGYGTINNIKTTAMTSLFGSADTKNIGVRPFDSSNKPAFMQWLFNVHPGKTEYFTPLRAALDKVGQYYMTDAPWISSGTSNTQLECRQSYAILMTDGYYTDGYQTSGISIKNGGEQDNISGPTSIESSKGLIYKYDKDIPPFASSFSNNLADIAMYYWKTDLKPNINNSVPTSKQNPAFWQHMVTFGVGLGVQGKIKREDAINAVADKKVINWPDPAPTSDKVTVEKIDDLLHAAINSRGDFFTANDPIAFAKGLAQTLNNIAERVGSASNIAATSINSLQTDSNLYQARYVAGEWSGDLWSYSSGNTDTPVWKASEKMPAFDERNIYFGSTDSAKKFEWGNMTPDEQKWLGNDPSIVAYIKGDQRLEKKNADGKFRNRVKILGDLVNSSPELVAEPQDFNYQRLNIAGASSYREFLNGEAKTRTPMIYVGGNDGMLHGFNANTGEEEFAYIPKNVMKPSGSESTNFLYKYAQPEYVHQFSVDGSPVAVDAYIGSEWKTILIGGLGRGSAKHSGGVGSIGGGFYAIDVTDPDPTLMNQSKVMWDKSFPEVGTFIGKPQVTLMNTGDWAVILGYGFNNSTNQSGILIINLANGEQIAKIATGIGSLSDTNAMSELSLVDKNADGTTDLIYGGDLHGNVWKFDVSHGNKNLWGIDYNSKPLFTAKDKSGNRQKITGGVMTAVEPKTGKVWVFFGTGQYLNQNDPSDVSTQSWYGIQDGLTIAGRAELEQRQITDDANYRIISDGASINKDKKGWYMDLPSTRERIVDMPMMVGSELIMNTVIPDTNVCNPSGSGYLMAISPFDGQRLKKPFFDLNNDDQFNDSDKVSAGSTLIPPSGVKVNSLNSVMTIVKEGELIKTVNNCEGACVEGRTINPTLNSGMQSWREITK